MTHTKGIAIFAMVASLILATGLATAQNTDPQQAVDEGITGQGGFTGAGGSASQTTSPGTVYEANVSSEQSTGNWAGLFGNATGNLVLGDSGDNRLYEWEARAEYVLASTSGAITWSNVQGAAASDLNGAITNFGSQSDNATETFNETATGYSGASTDAALTFDGSGSQAWTTALEATAASPVSISDFVFTGVAQPNSGTTAYDGSGADYQVIVPETGNSNTYNLYLELQ